MSNMVYSSRSNICGGNLIMSTIILIVVSLIVLCLVIWILGMVVSLIKTVLGVSVGIISAIGYGIINILKLLFYAPMRVVMLLVGLWVFDSLLLRGFFLLLFALTLPWKIRSDGKKEVEATLKSLIDSQGIIRKEYAEGIAPEVSSSTVIFNFFYDKDASKKYLNNAVDNQSLQRNTLPDGKQYYYTAEALQNFSRSITEDVFNASNKYWGRYGIVYDIKKILKEEGTLGEQKNRTWRAKASFGDTDSNASRNTDALLSRNSDALLSLRESYCELFFEEFCKSIPKEDRIQKKKDEIVVYISPKILAKKWAQIKYSYQIAQDQFSEIFGKHSIEIQKIIMDEIFLQDNELRYVYSSASSTWVEINYQASHTCFKCKKIVSQPKSYGPNIYCDDCLRRIHADEDAREEKGEAVKRYISAPPPNVKIH